LSGDRKELLLFMNKKRFGSIPLMLGAGLQLFSLIPSIFNFNDMKYINILNETKERKIK
jgi:hypothetical protein